MMTNRRLERSLAASALALEGAAAVLLALPGARGAALAALAHGLGATCAARFLVRRYAGSGAGAGRGSGLLFAVAAVALPVVGPIALAALIRVVARGPATDEPGLRRATLSAPADAALLAGPPAGVGLGSLEARLRFDPAPARRVAAVLATRRLDHPADATRLLRLALRDRQEDVRLLAHALLEERDGQAYRAIAELERLLASAPAARRGPLAFRLGEALFELCASGLVSGELESFTLRRARSLLEDARGALPIPAAAIAGRLLGQVSQRERG
jgi:hypothetical protein